MIARPAAAAGGGGTDGWSDEEDGPDALAADGARARRQALPNCLMDGLWLGRSFG